MNRNELQLYFIMGSQNCPTNQALSILEEALKGGVTCFQFREKGPNSLTGEAYIQFAKQCQLLCKHYQIPFIVNDDVELALLLNADGIHVGQEDASIISFKNKFPNKIIGLSIHTLAQLDFAVELGVDYVGIGPIFATSSKNDAKKPCGTEFLKLAKSTYPTMPIVAIGGISIDNTPSILATGVDGLSIISAIASAPNPQKMAQQFKNL